MKIAAPLPKEVGQLFLYNTANAKDYAVRINTNNPH
jgi:hypothetical protein